MLYFTFGWDDQGFWHHGGVQRTIRRRLSNGQSLRLFVYRTLPGEIAQVSLVVKKRGMKRRPKDGIASGPGGLEAWSVVAEEWPRVERYAASLGARQLVISGATPKLFRIYKHFLTRRGYWYLPVDQEMGIDL